MPPTVAAQTNDQAQDAASEREQILAAAATQVNHILAMARRRIWVDTATELLSRLPPLDLTEHLSRVARRTRHADLRLLVDDDLALKQQQPRLVHVLGRLTSRIAVRQIDTDQDGPATLLLTVDRDAWLFLLQQRTRMVLRGDSHDPAGARIAAEQFAERWQTSNEAMELRRWTL